MVRHARLLIAVLAFKSSRSAAQDVSTQGPAALTAAAMASRLDSLFDAWRGTDRPGCVVGVIASDGARIERAYGMADIERAMPLASDTPVHAASVAKQVTAYALMLLVRDGRLRLDDDVRRFIPELPDYSAHSGKAITVAHLLTHTSGLRDFFELLILARGRFEEERITRADALAMTVAQSTLNFAPGAEHLYSNTGYMLAALIVERVTGEPFAAFVGSRVFVPLGMTQSIIRDDVSTLTHKRALGYTRRGSMWAHSTPNFDVVGSTNLQTTAGDLLRWAELLLGRKGDTAIVRRMLTPAVLASGDTILYGLGVSFAAHRGFRLVEHGGNDPGFRAYVGVAPAHGVAASVLCNSTVPNAVALGREILGTVLPAQSSASAGVTSMSAGDSVAALRWAGVYVEPVTRQVAELTQRSGALYTAIQGGARVEAVGPRRARVVGSPLELEFDDEQPRSGYVVRWSVPGRRADRFVWQATAAPRLSRFTLNSYTGTYVSAEANATYRVEAGDSTLTIHIAGRPWLTARPVFPDAFVSGQYTIQFRRQRTVISGLEITHPRARGVWFSLQRAAPRGAAKTARSEHRARDDST